MKSTCASVPAPPAELMISGILRSYAAFSISDTSRA